MVHARYVKSFRYLAKRLMASIGATMDNSGVTPMMIKIRIGKSYISFWLCFVSRGLNMLPSTMPMIK